MLCDSALHISSGSGCQYPGPDWSCSRITEIYGLNHLFITYLAKTNYPPFPEENGYFERCIAWHIYPPKSLPSLSPTLSGFILKSPGIF